MTEQCITDKSKFIKSTTDFFLTMFDVPLKTTWEKLKSGYFPMATEEDSFIVLKLMRRRVSITYATKGLMFTSGLIPEQAKEARRTMYIM